MILMARRRNRIPEDVYTSGGKQCRAINLAWHGEGLGKIARDKKIDIFLSVGDLSLCMNAIVQFWNLKGDKRFIALSQWYPKNSRIMRRDINSISITSSTIVRSMSESRRTKFSYNTRTIAYPFAFRIRDCDD